MNSEAAPGGHPTRHWTRLDDGRVRCDVCPRACKLREGQRGFCFVRACQGAEVVLTTYGRSSGFCVDPVEKKPLHHFLPGSPVLSFGTAGCNLGCKFCQNWDMSRSREMATLADRATPGQIAAAAQANGCRSVAYTYNDPTVFMEYAIDTALACKELGIQSVAVTAGYMSPAPRAEFYAHMDAANVDLKAFSENFYHKVCSAHLKDVLETLRYLVHETRVWLELSTLLIPEANDSEQELKEMAKWVVRELGPDVPWHFSAFHPDWKMRDVPPTPLATLLKARDIAHEAGMRFVYVGNVHHPEADSTCCPSCGQLLIGRDWYTLTHWRLDAEGRCNKCKTQLPGIFDPLPGSWGAKRRPLRMGQV